MKKASAARLRRPPGPLFLPALLGLTLVACSSETGLETQTPGPTPSATAPAAQGQFTSSINGSGDYAEPAYEDAEGDDSPDDGGDREVEEADIVIQEGDILYVLNTYRGLQIFDVSDADDPEKLGELAIVGHPVEMYIRDGQAYIIISDYYSYWPMIEGDSLAAPAFRGSMIGIVDVQNPETPTLLDALQVEGYISQSRAVGDVLYFVSNRYAWYDCYGSTDDTNQTVITSVDIQDPTAITTVAHLNWPGTAAQIHATSDTLYVAETLYNYENDDDGEPDSEDGGEPDTGGDDGEDSSEGETDSEESEGSSEGSEGSGEGTDTPDEGSPDEAPPDEGGEEEEGGSGETPSEAPTSYYATQVTIVDISDPEGQMVERGQFTVPGLTWDKFALDEYDGTFRIVTQKWDGLTSGTLSVADIEDADDPTLLSTYDIILPILESVTATRFDDERAYIVTAERTDPLFVFDLSNPAEPHMAGELEMPGQLEHLMPRGDRLLAFGQDNEEEGTWRFAISLFDVSDMSTPTMLDRELVGEGDHSWSNANWDDKSFSVVDDLGLIALPFTAWDDNGYYVGGVQLAHFDDQDITLNGTVTHGGYIRRVREVNTRLYSISDTDLLVINAEDPDQPTLTSHTPLARNIVDYLPMGDLGIQLVASHWYGDTSQQMAEIRVVDGQSANELNAPLAQLSLPVSDGQLLALDDDNFGVLSNHYDADWHLHTQLHIIDISDPQSPQIRSTTALPAPVWSHANLYGSGYGSGGGIVVQSDGALAYLETHYGYGYDVEPEEAPAPAPEEEDGEDGESGEAEESESEEGSEGGSGHSESASKALEDEAIRSNLHIVDLSDLDSPTVSSHGFTESLFGLWAEASTLYLHFVEKTEHDEGPATGHYYLWPVDLNDPSAPDFDAAPINIPGTSIGKLADGQTFITIEGQWEESPEGYQYEALSLNTVALNGVGAERLGQVDLPGYINGLSLGDDSAYALSQDYWWDYDYNTCSSTNLSLLTLDLANVEAPTWLGEVEVPLSYGYLRAHLEDHLFIDGYTGGVLVYDLASAHDPVYEGFTRTNGYISRVRTQANRAFMPAGMYGVFSLDL